MAVPLRFLRQTMRRFPLSDCLPYIAFEDGIFLLTDGTGFVFECLPLIAVGQDTFTILKGLFEMDFPENTTIQISMFASRNIGHVLAAWAGKRTEPGSIYQTMAVRRLKHLSGESVLPGLDYNLRDFRLFISIKLPLSGEGREVLADFEEAKSCQTRVEQVLKTVNLNPYRMGAPDLMHLLSEILNPGHRPDPMLRYDSEEEIRHQLIYTDNEIRVQSDRLEMDGHTVVPLSVKQYPEFFNIADTNQLIGDLFQNTKQVFHPFIVTLNCIMLDPEKAKKQFELKAAANRYQSFGSMSRLIPKLGLKNEGFEVMLSGLTQGESLVKCYLHALVYGESPEAARRGAETMIAMWRGRSVAAQVDSYITLALFLDTLPLGLKAEEHRAYIKRARTMLSSNAATLAPIQADWKGTGTPTLIFSSRRGQIMAVDIFDNGGGNYNLAVVASSGRGKSFAINDLILSYLASGTRVWVIDVGRSYQKLCRLVRGQFIEFTDAARICLNPFTYVDPEKLDDEMAVLKPMIAQMASPSRALTDLENAFLEQAVKEAFTESGNETTITHVAQRLEGLEDDRALDLARMLYPYCHGGSYARYFEGKNNVEFTSKFIVLELEELKSKRDLQSVVLLFLIYIIQQYMYRGSKEERKMCIIDEAWDLMGEGNTAKFIETGYRRVRKYNGSMVTITQGINDLYQSSHGQAVAGNSDFFFLLQQKPESLAALKDSQRMVLDSFSYELLRTVHTTPGLYSEIFIQCPAGHGVGRLIVDPFSYYLYSTTPRDVVKVDRYLGQGLSITEAIERCLEEEQSS